MKLADYVIFLYNGSVIETGPAGTIFKAPKKALTRAYIKGEYLDEIWVRREAELMNKEGSGI